MSRVEFPEPKDEPEWKDFERGQYARSFGYYDDGSSDDVAPTTESTEIRARGNRSGRAGGVSPDAEAEAQTEAEAAGDHRRTAPGDDCTARARDAGAHRARQP